MKKVLLSLMFTVAAAHAVAGDTPNLQACAKDYPRAALMNEETGTVAVQVQTDADGKVVDAKVTKSSGSKTLDKGTISQVQACKLPKGNAGQFNVEFVWKLS